TRISSRPAGQPDLRRFPVVIMIIGRPASPGCLAAQNPWIRHRGPGASPMIGCVLILGISLAGADGPRGAAGATAADRIILRDGAVVLGLVTAATSGPRGSVEFLVRRDWAAKHLEDHLADWERSSAAANRHAVEQRRQRLVDWRRDRAEGVGPEDRILPWID